ncbi:pentapeptide repeat-containing protein [Saccharopolyspora phatthalungensis]|uniref:Uncharacterized protein YjbI with pentapeptide repeats n=1 Tax=Saccharopolyspora phatthalungensis TaxID=664693 RepID=A0A840Q6S5_9PSEU|nr:pentapeptide repeat-containing protein [Saccharopolyspora phatthalungensis]MBB5152523.1 uncharacterized protein YjbI with pentapeptide repeats [Saccharopolyspora phatthalungensis]
MDFRKLGNGLTVQRPSFDPDYLSNATFTFHGEFDGDEIRVESGEFTDLRGKGSLAHSFVRSVDLSGAQLSPLELSDVRFEDVELSSASWQSVKARRIEIIRSRAMGFRLSFESASDVYIDGCRLDYASIHVEAVKGALAFNECLFREATISGDLSNVVFQDCSLDGVEFESTKAMGCDLTTSQITGARGLIGLRGARVTAEQATSVAIQLAAEAGLTVSD